MVPDESGRPRPWLRPPRVRTPADEERHASWLAIEYAMPVLAQRIHARLPVDPSHVPERFALFTIIVLGESVVAVALGTADQDWRLTSAATAALGFAAVACLWWVYFDRGIDGGLSSRTGAMQIFTRVHIPLLGALTAVGAGVLLATLAGVLTPVSFAACSTAALTALVVYEIRLGLVRGP